MHSSLVELVICIGKSASPKAVSLDVQAHSCGNTDLSSFNYSWGAVDLLTDGVAVKKQAHGRGREKKKSMKRTTETLSPNRFLSILVNEIETF